MVSEWHKLLGKALAEHTAVALPPLGSLVPERVPARRAGRTVQPPRWVVRFTRKPTGTPLSVLAAEAACIGPDEAASHYEAWLRQVTTKQGIDVEGVGRIEHGFFRAAPELERAFDPLALPTLQLPRRRAIGLWLGLAGRLLLAGATAIIFIGPRDGPYRSAETAALTRQEMSVRGERWNPPHTAPAHESDAPPASQPVVTPPSESAAKPSLMSATPPVPYPSLPPTGSAGAPARKPLTDAGGQPASGTPGSAASLPGDAPADAALRAPTSGRNTSAASAPAVRTVGAIDPEAYYAVLGVFSTEANALRFVRQTVERDPALDCSLTAFAGGKVMVSALVTRDRAAAERFLREHRKAYPEAWLYTRRR